jgi:hypothetical protein
MRRLPGKMRIVSLRTPLWFGILFFAMQIVCKKQLWDGLINRLKSMQVFFHTDSPGDTIEQRVLKILGKFSQ